MIRHIISFTSICLSLSAANAYAVDLDKLESVTMRIIESENNAKAAEPNIIKFPLGVVAPMEKLSTNTSPTVGSGANMQIMSKPAPRISANKQ